MKFKNPELELVFIIMYKDGSDDKYIVSSEITLFRRFLDKKDLWVI